MSNGLVSDLRRLVGAGHVSTERGDVELYSGDALGLYRAFRASDLLTARPAAVVWPGSTEDVFKLLRYLDGRRIPVVPYGGGTGVMGGTTAADGCVVLSVQRLDTIESVSRQDRLARVRAGVVLGDLATAASAEGLLMGHDPWSRPIATVGGAISTNGVGYLAARYGSMGDQVLGLEVVLANGEVVRTKGVPGPSPGPSLDSLFIGAEGTLGVITRAVVQLYPQPEKRLLRAPVFPDFESGFHAVCELESAGIRPAMVDYGDEDWSSNPVLDREATLYLAFEGTAEEVEAQDERARQVCARFGGREDDPDEARRSWETRHASAQGYRRDLEERRLSIAERRHSSDYRIDYLHVSLPISSVLEYRRQCGAILASRDIVVREWSLWGRPEYFSFLIERVADGDDTAPMAEAVDRVLTLAQDMGGSMEYCHGVGVKLGHLYHREHGSGIEVLRRIKRALDPNGILNPGKLAPGNPDPDDLGG